MEGQLLPAQARVQSAVMTANPKATSREERDQNDAAGAGERQTRCSKPRLPAGHARKLAGCEARFQRVRYAPMSRSSRLLDRPRLPPGRDARPRRAPAPGPDHRLRRVRPDRRLAPRRQPGAGDGPGLAAARGHTPIALVGGGTGMVGDPSGKRQRAPGARRSSRSTATPSAIGRPAPRFLRVRGRQRGPAPQQRRLAARPPPDGVPARHRQALHRQLHAAEGVGAEPDGDAGSRTPSSATCWSRRTTTGTCSTPRAASSRWAAATSGATSRPASSWWTGASGARCTAWSSRSSPPPPAPSSARAKAGNIWLDPERTSPYHFYQFWLNTDDRDVERYLKLFTFLRLDRIAADDGASTRRTRAGARPSGCWPAR